MKRPRWPRPRWYRWTMVIVGEESGHVSSLPFLRFRHFRDAVDKCAGMNARHVGRDAGGATHFEVREIS